MSNSSSDKPRKTLDNYRELIQRLLDEQHQSRWLSDEFLNGIAVELKVPLHRVESIASFYTHFERTCPKSHVVRICRDLSCKLADKGQIKELKDTLKNHSDIEIRDASCLGRCDSAPAVTVDNVPTSAKSNSVLSRISGSEDLHLGTSYISHKNADPYTKLKSRYGALRKALADSPEMLPLVLEEAGLRGMGGAGFPTGKKWGIVRSQEQEPKYVICNADESEPGTFKDRQILYDFSHLVIEGMILAGYAIGSNKGILFIRHEYEYEKQRFEAALDQARKIGALGRNIFDSNFSFDIEVFVSPGGYILGEESALLECLEGRRGEPRNKPPFPGTSGLYGLPTLINNVETLAHVPGIVVNGRDWWKNLGRNDCYGQKFISVSGDVEMPGVFLVPMGTTLGELLDRAGGMRNGTELIALAPGGASSNFLPNTALDLSIDFDVLLKAGSMLGSGAVLFVGAGQNLLDAAVNVAAFFRNESCGKCVPCRVGTEKAVDLLESSGVLRESKETVIRDLHETLRQTSICGLGQIALGPLVSVLDNFSESTDATRSSSYAKDER